MTTTTLQRAIQSLSALPDNVQDELGQKLLAYASRWQKLKLEIDRGTDELARGEGIEVTDVDLFLDKLTKNDGRS